MRQRTTVASCRLLDSDYEMLKIIAGRVNLPIGLYLRVIIRELLSNRLQIRKP